MNIKEKSQEKKKRIYFIGIGGIGVSALAKYYLSRGFSVSGSDLTKSGILDELRRLGARMIIGHRKENLRTDADLVVYSAAVTEDNLELKEARRRKIKCQTYAEALGDLTKKYFTIAVSGTHGKSTTTAMIALIFVEAGLDPTVIVGTKVRWATPKNSPPTTLSVKGGEYSNFRAGRGKYLVIEADEYAASFLNYWPKIIVLTNIEEDHLDYYGNLKNILKAFKEYIRHLSKNGVLVANEEDENINKILDFRNYVIARSDPPGGGERRGNLVARGKKTGLLRFARNDKDAIKLKEILKVPGEHNVLDALAALNVARVLKVPDEISFRALSKFHGTWRRFEYKGEVNGAKIFDDYGHHPTEIKATLKGAREFLSRHCEAEGRSNPVDGGKMTGLPRRLPLASKWRAPRNDKGKLWCVFQPHQYQRTFALFSQFAGAFDEADRIVLLPIYSVAGREKETIRKKVSSEKLAEAIRSRMECPSTTPSCRRAAGLRLGNKKCIVYLNSFDKAAKYLRKNLKKGDIAVIMGAGDIYKLTEKLFSYSL